MRRPAPGFRDSGIRGSSAGGTLHYVGDYGFSWSSSFTGTRTYYLELRCDWLAPNSGNTRAIGLQMRCLQE